MSGKDLTSVTAKRLSESATGSTEIEQLVCARCQPLEARVAELNQALQSMSDENTALAAENAGLTHQIKRAASSEIAMRNELNRVREEDPKAEVIKSILQHWLRVTGRAQRKGRKASISMSSKRAQVVKKALRFHPAEDLIEALNGLALVPYVGEKGRKPIGTERERYDEVEHALGDETKVDRFIGYAQRATSSSAQQRESIFETWQKVNALEHEWARLVLDAACARESGVEPANLEEYLRAKRRESDERWPAVAV